MDKNITIPIEEKLLENFSDEARQELENQSKEILTNLINEAILLEAQRRKMVGKPIVQKIDVTRAVLFPELADEKNNKKPWWKKVLHGVVPGLSFLPGVIYKPDNLYTHIACLVIIIIVVLLTVYLMED